MGIDFSFILDGFWIESLTGVENFSVGLSVALNEVRLQTLEPVRGFRQLQWLFEQRNDVVRIYVFF